MLAMPNAVGVKPLGEFVPYARAPFVSASACVRNADYLPRILRSPAVAACKNLRPGSVW
ncbi:hypothetical protein SEEPBA42_09228 [Salmonella enterica subsp. enterica serovar Paratyphi B str. SARA42]|nr:hypothetical protein SEEPBA42_09228 [Salmonella enterica subsp. enterica serovar Paratyphi B str. SARA42]